MKTVDTMTSLDELKGYVESGEYSSIVINNLNITYEFNNYSLELGEFETEFYNAINTDPKTMDAGEVRTAENIDLSYNDGATQVKIIALKIEMLDPASNS